MSKYKIEWLERTVTKTGKEKADVNVTNLGDNQKFEKVTVWADFPDFANLAAGREVEADIIVSMNGKYTNRTLVPIKVQTTQGGANKSFGGGVKAAQERTREMVEAAQDNKEISIRLASTSRGAIDLMIAEKDSDSIPWDAEMMKNRLLFWRKWLIDNWDTKVDTLKAPF